MIGAKVDALALMLDGAIIDGAHLGRFNVYCLEIDSRVNAIAQSSMAKASLEPDWAEVAEAILELEAWADWCITRHGQWKMEPRLGLLAARATVRVVHAGADLDLSTDDPTYMHHRSLEAAALLRDGWRPGGEP